MSPERRGPVTHHPDVDTHEGVAGCAGDGEGVPLVNGHSGHADECVLTGPVGQTVTSGLSYKCLASNNVKGIEDS